MEISPFDYSPLYQYKVDDMLFNVNVMKKSFKSMKYVIYNYIDNVHEIHNNLINNARSMFDVNKAIGLFKVAQQDLVNNFTSLALHKLSDDKDMINYSYHNVSSGTALYSMNEYWAQIYKIPKRGLTVLFDDETKLTVFNPPTIQINLDLNNRHFSLNYFTDTYSKKFQLNSYHLAKVLNYIDENEYENENADIAIFNLLKFFESIFDLKHIRNHPLQILEAKLDLVLHELEGVEKLIKLRAHTN